MIELLCCRVFLLAEGRVAFSGPVRDALEFFRRYGIIQALTTELQSFKTSLNILTRTSKIILFKLCSNGHPCPNNYNPADHFVITLAIEPGQETQCREKIKVRHGLSKLQKKQYIENVQTM